MLGRHSPGVEPGAGAGLPGRHRLGRVYGDEEAGACWCASRHRARCASRCRRASRGTNSRPGWPPAPASSARATGSSPRRRPRLSPRSPRGLAPPRAGASAPAGAPGHHTIGQFGGPLDGAVAEQLGGECLPAPAWPGGATAAHPRPAAADARGLCGVRRPRGRLEPLAAALAAASGHLLRDLKQGNLAVRRVEAQARLPMAGGCQIGLGGGPPGPHRLDVVLRELLGRLGGRPGVMEAWLRLVGLEPWVGRQLDLFAHAAERRAMEGHAPWPASTRRLRRARLPGGPPTLSQGTALPYCREVCP